MKNRNGDLVVIQHTSICHDKHFGTVFIAGDIMIKICMFSFLVWESEYIGKRLN